MAFSRQLGVVGILSACFFVAVGCGDDDKKGTGGEAGEGGDSGSSTAGTGGKAAGGSSSGNAGTAGKAGSAGSATEGGGAGESGSGGGGAAPVGGMAGEGGSAGAAAAAGGEGGAPGPAFTQCAGSCTADADCEIEGGGRLKCDLESNHCYDPGEVCEVAADCGPSITFFFECETAEDCAIFQAGDTCVEWLGSGYCATAADPEFGCLGGSAQSFPEFDNDGDVAVCVNDGAICGSNDRCAPGCALQGCEGVGTCDEETGLCGCSTAADCDNGVCGDDGQCAECVTSEDCAEDLGGNVACIDGKCGCSSVDDCPAYWDTATPVCE